MIESVSKQYRRSYMRRYEYWDPYCGRVDVAGGGLRPEWADETGVVSLISSCLLIVQSYTPRPIHTVFTEYSSIAA